MDLLPALLAALLAAAIAAGEPAARTEFDATLNDGSRLLGFVRGAHFVVRTPLGEQTIPFKVLRRVEHDEQKGEFLFILQNKDEVAGVPKTPAFELMTVAGKLAVPFAKVVTIEATSFVKAERESLKKGLQIHFTFEEAEGKEITNLTGRTAAATLVEGTRAKGTIVLDGRGDHILLPNHDSFEKLDRFTISIWTRLRTFGPGGYANEHGYLVNKGDDMWWNPAWCLGYSKASGAGRRGAHPGPLPALFIIGTSRVGGRAECRVNSRTLLNRGEWYHVVGTYDGKTARIHVNGRPSGERDYVGALRRDQAPLLLGGGRLGGTSFGNHFTTDAAIDNFRFYSRALSNGEIRLLHELEAK